MLPMAEQIIALDRSGTILAQGKFSHVQAYIPMSAVANGTVEEHSTSEAHEVSSPKVSGNIDQSQVEDELMPATTTGGAGALKYYFHLASWPAWAGFYVSLSIVVCMNSLMSNYTVI